MDEFRIHQVGTLDDVNHTYVYIRDIVSTLGGNVGKFYPKFYKIIAETDTPFINLSRKCSLLLDFEVANHVLAHLTGTSFKEDVLTFKHDTNQFLEKDKSVIAYFSGYVLRTMY